MGFFGRTGREGAGRPLPRRGLKRLVLISATHFWKLMGANLLFVFFSLPVITLPAALCALNRVCLLIYREGNSLLWLDFWGEFRQSFLRSLLPGALFGAAVFTPYFLMSLGAANGAYPVWCMLFWSLGIALTAGGLLWGAYFFALVPLLELGNMGVLKGAFLLCMLRPGRALLALLIMLGMAFTAAVLMPVFLFALLLFWFAALQMGVCCLVNGAADEFILEPYARDHT